MGKAAINANGDVLGVFGDNVTIEMIERYSGKERAKNALNILGGSTISFKDKEEEHYNVNLQHN